MRARGGGTGRDARAGRRKATPTVVAAREEWDVRSFARRYCGGPRGSQHTHAACSRECLNQGVPVREKFEPRWTGQVPP
ncbi:hypothetical protein PVAP13_1KG388405 [Panicum virgatum]|uniref:Uncharacterized protein n=1 Tax=Panicum virgatum TaxID=38727 RepID=A0A8T0XKK8_PANVG|nr:hypothetical protein PVAP13_1KG388405 [Panicum virgatum]